MKIDYAGIRIATALEGLPTLRDQFAMAFLSGVAGTLGSAKVIYFSDIARDAYAAADAMMEARDEKR